MYQLQKDRVNGRKEEESAMEKQTHRPPQREEKCRNLEN